MNVKNILVVDDEELMRNGIKKTLEGWSEGRYHIATAKNGSEAMKVFETNKVHLLVTDICMPEMTGLAMLKKIKETGQQPVVLVISSYADFEYAQEALRLGVVNYLLKPLNKQKLIEAVEEALTVGQTKEKTELMRKVADEKLLTVDHEQIRTKLPVKEAIAYIEKNINSSLTLREVAEHVHLNASYFSLLFKEQTGLTFSDYLTRKKMQIAKNLLITSDLSVEEIAEKSGYQTAKYFIKIFKNFEGITPSKYRKIN